MVFNDRDLLASVELMHAHNGAVEVAEIMPHILDKMNEAERQEHAFLAAQTGELAVAGAIQ